MTRFSYKDVMVGSQMDIGMWTGDTGPGNQRRNAWGSGVRPAPRMPGPILNAVRHACDALH